MEPLLSTAYGEIECRLSAREAVELLAGQDVRTGHRRVGARITPGSGGVGRRRHRGGSAGSDGSDGGNRNRSA